MNTNQSANTARVWFGASQPLLDLQASERRERRRVTITFSVMAGVMISVGALFVLIV